MIEKMKRSLIAITSFIFLFFFDDKPEKMKFGLIIIIASITLFFFDDTHPEMSWLTKLGINLFIIAFLYAIISLGRWMAARDSRVKNPSITGYTKSGMYIVGIITVVALEIAYYTLKEFDEYIAPKEIETAMTVMRLGALFVVLNVLYPIAQTAIRNRSALPNERKQLSEEMHALTRFVGLLTFPLVAYVVPKDPLSLNVFSVIFLIGAYSVRYKSWKKKLCMIGVVISIACCVRFLFPIELQTIGQYLLPALMLLEAGRTALFGIPRQNTHPETGIDIQESSSKLP